MRDSLGSPLCACAPAGGIPAFPIEDFRDTRERVPSPEGAYGKNLTQKRSMRYSARHRGVKSPLGVSSQAKKYLKFRYFGQQPSGNDQLCALFGHSGNLRAEIITNSLRCSRSSIRSQSGLCRQFKLLRDPISDFPGFDVSRGDWPRMPLEALALCRWIFPSAGFSIMDGFLVAPGGGPRCDRNADLDGIEEQS